MAELCLGLFRKMAEVKVAQGINSSNVKVVIYALCVRLTQGLAVR